MSDRSATPLRIPLLFAVAVSGCGDVDGEALPSEPTLSDVQALVFTPACATSGCHDSNAAGGLDLSDEAHSRVELIDAMPTNPLARRSDWRRVAPGEVERSFLMRKIRQPGLGEGAPMPIARSLAEPYIELVETWIQRGAP